MKNFIIFGYYFFLNRKNFLLVFYWEKSNFFDILTNLTLLRLKFSKNFIDVFKLKMFDNFFFSILLYF